MNTQRMMKYTKGGWRFVGYALCRSRYNAGRSIGHCASSRWQSALMNDWWAKHTGQKSPEVVHVDCNVELCPKLKEEEQHGS